jgi:hypothetical protein
VIFENPLTAAGTPALLASLCGFGMPGCSVDAALNYPFGLAIDANGRLLVADASNNRIALFTSFADGLQPVNAIIGVATTGLVNGPADCDTADSSRPCLPDFDPTGLLLPNDAYLADLQGPTNIELDHKGHLLVADSSNMRVQRFVQPTMTLTTGVSGTSFTTGDTITLTVVAATTEPAGLTNVKPSAQPLAFTGGSCGAGSSTGLVTTLSPTSYQVGSGPATASAPSVTLAAGNPVTFTMTFTAAGGSGPVVFSAGATGVLANGNTASQQRNLDSIAINDAGLPPSTTVTSTPAAPNGTVASDPGELGWFVGALPATVIHLAGSNAGEIDWSITDQDPTHSEPSSYQVQCGASRDVEITREGHTLLWYRSVSPSGQIEAWHTITILRSFGPGVSLTLAPSANQNNWYNAPVTVSWQASDVIAGLNHVDWSGDGVVSGSSTSLTSSSFVTAAQGAALTATVTATSNSGATGTGTVPFRIDSTPPVISATHAINAIGTAVAATASGGWYRTGLDVVFSASDALSGFGSGGTLTVQQTVSVTGEGNNLSAPVTFTDQAGNTAAATVTGLKIDSTPPTVAVTAVSASTNLPIGPAPTGWFNIATGKPRVIFTPTDPGAQPSGLVSGTTPQSVTVSADTTGTTLTSNTFADVAGNTATASYTYKMDTVAPTLTAPLLAGPAGIVPNALGYFDLTGRTDGVVVNVTASDAAPASSGLQVCYDLSGGATCTPAAAGSGAGAFSLTVFSSVTNGRIWSLDGAGNASTPQALVVKITRSAPVANGLNFATPVNTPYSGSLTSNGAAGTVAYSVATAPMAGSTLTLNTNGTFSYTPKTGYAGSDSFTFTATDVQTGAHSSATVNVVVGNGTAAPVAANGSFNTNEDAALTIQGALLVTDTDTPATDITLAIVTPPAHGTAAVVGSTIVYTPAADYNGSDSIGYKASDPQGNASNTAALSVSIAAVNDTPSFTPGASQTVNEDAAPVTVANWATNINKGAVNESAQAVDFIVANSNAALFSAQPAVSPAGTLTYTVAPNANGTATVTVKIHDNGGGADTSAPVTFTITVNAVNDAPTFTAGPAVSVLQGSGAQTFAGWATAISAGPNEVSQTVTFLVTNGNNALFSVQPAISPSGTLTFTPAANAIGTATITVRLQDNGGTLNGGVDTSAAQTFTITIKALNQNPVCSAAAADPKVLWPPNHRFVPISIAGVTDPDAGDALTIAVTRIWQDESTMADGSGDTPIDAAIVNGAAQVRAERAGTGDGRVYQLFFTATDGKGGSCSGTVTVGVPHDQGNSPVIDSGVRYDSLVVDGPPVAGAAPNRRPVATADSASTFKGIATTIAVLSNDTDPDGNTLTVTAVSKPGHGTASINAGKTVTYTPLAGYGGADSFTYTVSDGHGGTATAKVTITIASHFVGDACAHDRHSYGGHDNDGSDHDLDTRRR